MKFREFLLNEDSGYLSQKIGDILSILHATQEDKDGLGSRDIEKDAQKVINQINWCFFGTLDSRCQSRQ